MILTPSSWMILMLVLVILELLLGAHFVFLWLGLSAGFVALLLSLLPVINWQLQIIIYSIAACSCLVFWNLYLKKVFLRKDKDQIILNDRGAQYIGRVIELTSPIENGRGRIKIGDSFWSITSINDIPAGNKVKIISCEGVTLTVELIKS